MNNKIQKTPISIFNKSLVIVAILILIIGIVILIKHFFFVNNYTTTNDAQIEQYVTPVASRVSGFVEKVNFEENQFVHKGDTLFIIDAREYKNKVDIAEAELSASKSNAEVLEKSISVTANSISVQKSRLEAAKVAIWRTTEEFKRFENLYQENAVSRQKFEEIKAAYETAQAQYNTIEEEYKSALLATSKEKANALPIQSTIEEKKAQLNNSSLYLSYTVVLAPFDGWVGRKNIQEGQLIKEGQNLVNVVSKEKWLTANFRETQLEHLEIGTPVTIKADAFPNHIFKGKIVSLSPASGSKFSVIPQDNATGNFIKIEQRIPVKILFDKSENIDRLLAGMNVLVNASNEEINKK